jgi:small subunit ribosomal protein S16
VAVKIRLKRMGKIRAPFYRVVIMDSRTKRDGRAIEEIGKYHAHYWLAQGAQPTEAVAALLKVVDGGTLKTKEPKTAKKDLYEAALAAAGKSDDGGSRKKAEKKADAPKADAAKAEAPKADEAKTDAPAADEATSDDTAKAEA